MLQMKFKTIVIKSPGPAENMLWEDLDIDFPPKGHVTVKHSYIGLNYIDTYHRSGFILLPSQQLLAWKELEKLLR